MIQMFVALAKNFVSQRESDHLWSRFLVCPRIYACICLVLRFFGCACVSCRLFLFLGSFAEQFDRANELAASGSVYYCAETVWRIKLQQQQP